MDENVQSRDRVRAGWIGGGVVISKGSKQCMICDKMFSTTSNLRNHTKRKHQVQVAPLVAGPNSLYDTEEIKKVVNKEKAKDYYKRHAEEVVI